MTEGIRLNKYLASCGVGSRRACEEWIQAGRVTINGTVETRLATRVAAADVVKVDAKRVAPKSTAVVILHKPRGLVCSREDELGRATIYSLLPRHLQGLQHVGRLDLDSEGLLVLTNDGALAQRLTHPSREVEKEYYVTANQAFENEHLSKFLEGIYTPETGRLVAKTVERISPRRIRIVLQHGAKRQIRVMFEALGYKVTKLLRVRIGQLWLGDLEPGDWAVLSPLEITMLLGQPAPAPRKRKISAASKPEGRKPEGRKPAGRRPEGRKPEGRKPEGRKPEGGKPAGHKLAGRKLAGRKLEGHKPSTPPKSSAPIRRREKSPQSGRKR